MVSRCMSAVDRINEIALEVEKKHHQNDNFNIAAQTLTRIRKERNFIGHPRKDQPQRHASLPTNFAKDRRQSQAGPKIPSRVSIGNVAHDKRNGALFPRDASSRKSLPNRCKSSKTSKYTFEERPKTVDDVSKSYTNRCVKEILNKIEHGSYASEWYSFNNPRLPSPKWIDFNSSGSGGILDAFLCERNDHRSDQMHQACYMMDVRIGEKVGRLLKYPGRIRVGQNGKTREQGNDFVEDAASCEASVQKGEENKTRPFPLSWTEQLSWENVKVITTNGKDFDDKKHNKKNTSEPNWKKFDAQNTQNEDKHMHISKPAHGYYIKPTDVRILQSMPNLTKRQKSIRGFCIDNHGKMNLNSNTSRLLHAGKSTNRDGLEKYGLRRQEIVENMNYLSPKTKYKSGLFNGRQEDLKSGSNKKLGYGIRNKHLNDQIETLDAIKLENIEDSKGGEEKAENNDVSLTSTDKIEISYDSAEMTSFRDLNYMGDKRLDLSESKRKTRAKRYPHLEVDPAEPSNTRENLTSSETKTDQESNPTTRNILLFLESAAPEATGNYQNDYGLRLTQNTTAVEKDIENNQDALLKLDCERTVDDNAQHSPKEQLIELRRSIHETRNFENSQLETDLRLLQLRPQSS